MQVIEAQRASILVPHDHLHNNQMRMPNHSPSWLKPIPVPSLGGAQQKVAIAPPIFPREALVGDRQAFSLEPLDCLFPARVVVVTSHVSPSTISPGTAGSRRAERLAKAWSICDWSTSSTVGT